jgi:8-oxo-dGTP diphosphatase
LPAAKPLVLSVRALILDDRGRCLLLKRRNGDNHFPGQWEFPGGKLDPCETVGAALAREVLEETGLSIDIGSVAGFVESELPEWRIVHLVFMARITLGEIRLSKEHQAYKWMPLPELNKTDMPEHLLRFVQGYLKQGGIQ